MTRALAVEWAKDGIRCAKRGCPSRYSLRGPLQFYQPITAADEAEWELGTLADG
jgi:hypothetical protein